MPARGRHFIVSSVNADLQEIATRLCAACGMCCNGILFQSVVLQEGDAPRQLNALGLKVKRRGGELSFMQPCPAHAECRCTVYESRPARCRLFVCGQLLSLESGATNEAAAMEKIREARKRTARVQKLLAAAGDGRENKSLRTRYAAAFTEPLDPATSVLRDELKAAMDDLEALLSADFRVE